MGGEGGEERSGGGGWEVAVGSEGEDCGKAGGGLEGAWEAPTHKTKLPTTRLEPHTLD